MTTQSIRNSISRSPFRLAFFLIPLVLAWFALSSVAQAQLSPAPDGGYGDQNTAEGQDALFNLAPNGVRNTAVGFEALFSNTGGGANTAIGAAALTNNTANDNTACGSYALTSNTTGSGNTAIGIDAMMLNINGNSNHASGHDALFNNTSGSNNTANGCNALFSNTAGFENTATGFQALFTNSASSGSFNTATGARALESNVSGGNNTATGVVSLLRNATGTKNTADGARALGNNTTGSSNVAVGFGAGINLTTGNHNIDIGNFGVAAESATIRIGSSSQIRTFIAGISGVPITGATVEVNAAGQLGVAPSAQRFKDEIKPMDKASEAILTLKPVSFRYKKEIDPNRTPQFGLVAEDVAKVNPDLVVCDEQGKVYTVRYDAVNAMLLNEFLKEHQKVQRLEAALAAVNERLKAQDAKIDKVYAKVELTKPAPQIVGNNQ